ncbi:hypothetical protein E9Q_02473 [Moraxella catarrhalis BC1]|nr:hypothetical protein E9Q_02473 [Moraxella catarrhalis BC1]
MIAFMANAPMCLVSVTTHNKGWQGSTTAHKRLGLFPFGLVFTPITPP